MQVDAAGAIDTCTGMVTAFSLRGVRTQGADALRTCVCAGAMLTAHAAAEEEERGRK